MKIGIYGGSFNPPHLGHVLAAQDCKRQLGLDRVLVIPASIPPHKLLSDGSPAASQRLALTRLAFEALGGFSVLDLELRRAGKSYTVDTIRQLRAQYPGDTLYLMMGTDMFLSFQDWYCPAEIARMAELVCFSRYAADSGDYEALRRQAELLAQMFGKTPVLLQNECLEISSTQVRRLLFFGLAEPYVPQAVLQQIAALGLYGVGGSYRCLPFESLRAASLALHKSSRAAHAEGVWKTAEKLAVRFGADAALAARAGVLHDVTKALSDRQQLALAEKLSVPLTAFERANPQLLHAKTGAAAARAIFGECEAVGNAIAWHTTGKPDMTALEKIIYLADMIEPGRKYPGVEQIRAAAAQDLDTALLLALERTITYLQDAGLAVCEDSVHARDFLLRERNRTQHEA